MATVLNLNRSAYLDPGKVAKTLDYLSAKYANLRYIVPARDSYTITSADECNSPGLAFDFYGSRDYWWVILLFNGILDPVGGLYVGLTLQLPSLADVNAFLAAQDASTESDLNVVV